MSRIDNLVKVLIITLVVLVLSFCGGSSDSSGSVAQASRVDTNGLFYTYAITGFVDPLVAISSFFLDENGVNPLSSFSIDTIADEDGISLNNGIPLSIRDGRIITASGESIDIAKHTNERLFLLPPGEPGSYYASVLLDNDLSHTYFLSTQVARGLYDSAQGILGFYDSMTGEELGNFSIPDFNASFFHPSTLVDMPMGVVVVSAGPGSIYLINNSEIRFPDSN